MTGERMSSPRNTGWAKMWRFEKKKRHVQVVWQEKKTSFGSW